LKGSVDEAIVNVGRYFYHSVEGVAYNVIPLKVIIEKNEGYNVIPPTPSIIHLTIQCIFPSHLYLSHVIPCTTVHILPSCHSFTFLNE